MMPEGKAEWEYRSVVLRVQLPDQQHQHHQ